MGFTKRELEVLMEALYTLCVELRSIEKRFARQGFAISTVGSDASEAFKLYSKVEGMYQDCEEESANEKP